MQDHRRAITARYERALAEVLTDQTGTTAGSAEPCVAAVALVGPLRAGVETAEGAGGIGSRCATTPGAGHQTRPLVVSAV